MNNTSTTFSLESENGNDDEGHLIHELNLVYNFVEFELYFM